MSGSGETTASRRPATTVSGLSPMLSPGTNCYWRRICAGRCPGAECLQEAKKTAWLVLWGQAKSTDQIETAIQSCRRALETRE